MSAPLPGSPVMPPVYRQVRWWVLALLFLVTVINFVDRQALSIVAPILREKLNLSVQDYSQIVAGFAFGMLVGEFPMGWLMDRFGVRLILPFAVVWWSIGNGLHALGATKWQFAALRFWLGTGECANFSGGVKVVQQWFPPKERAFAAGVFNGGATIGSIIAPPLLVLITTQLGWQMAFILPSAFGVLWVIAWRAVYREPQRHPHLSSAEAAYITAGTPTDEAEPSNLELLRRKDVWALMLCRMIAGPVPQFYLFWLPEYLYRERGLSLTSIGLFAWIPFLFGDLGSVGGGWLAGKLIQRGWTVSNARKFVMWAGAICCLFGFGVTAAGTAASAIALICVVLLGHYAFSANMFARVSDLTPSAAVSRVTGLTGVSQHISNSGFQLLIGWLVTYFGYGQVFAITAVAPAIAVAILFGLTKHRRE
ncbi:MAG: MFS transporter [Bryobacteraceae bacterium]|nr:MFS transporter [Bryobacteraceae bacterium]